MSLKVTYLQPKVSLIYAYKKSRRYKSPSLIVSKRTENPGSSSKLLGALDSSNTTTRTEAIKKLSNGNFALVTVLTVMGICS